MPLKGAAIFFVNGGTGYSLLYLAKQTEYTQNLPMVQQMVNSLKIGSGGPIQKVAAQQTAPGNGVDMIESQQPLLQLCE